MIISILITKQNETNRFAKIEILKQSKVMKIRFIYTSFINMIVNDLICFLQYVKQYDGVLIWTNDH